MAVQGPFMPDKVHALGICGGDIIARLSLSLRFFVVMPLIPILPIAISTLFLPFILFSFLFFFLYYFFFDLSLSMLFSLP